MDDGNGDGDGIGGNTDDDTVHKATVHKRDMSDGNRIGNLADNDEHDKILIPVSRSFFFCEFVAFFVPRKKRNVGRDFLRAACFLCDEQQQTSSFLARSLQLE